MSTRLFVAIDLDEPTRAALVREQARVAAMPLGRGARFLPAASLHVTLVFIGEVEAARVPPFVSAMEPAIERAPFEASFGGIGMFPARGAPRILWLGLRSGIEETVALHAEVLCRLGPLGVRGEPRPLHPHVTLARWKSDSARPRHWSPEPDRTVGRMWVTAVTLFESRLSAAGSTYTALATTPLRWSPAS